MPPDQVDLTGLSDEEVDDDEGLRQAIALSLLDQENSKVVEPEPEEDPKKATFGSLVLDRKAMEAERLKRLAGKRERPVDDEVEAALPPPKKQATSKAPDTARRTLPATASSSQPRGSHGSLKFPNGVVKKTWALGYPRTGDDVKIEEVLQKDQLELAILSSFQWDTEWIMSKVNLRSVKLLMVAYAVDDAQKQDMKENAPPNVRFSFPPMNGPGNMHSKLQVLKFPDYIRIVVPTGNLVPYDWGETGVMENMVFLIDLPRLPDTSEHRPTEFSTELCRFLRACQVDEKLVLSLSNYDFSRTTQLGFVHTIPGGHTDELRRRTGYCGLGDTVSRLGLATSNLVDVDLMCASLGAINISLVEAIYNACQGDNGMKEYNARTTRKPAAKSTTPSQTLKDHFRVYFPTEQTVASTRGGRGAAGTICVQARWWRSPTFPTGLFRDCVSNRPRGDILMHTKIIFVRGTEAIAKDEGTGMKTRATAATSKAWAYVGSANLSESAWGRLVKDGKTGKPKMSCRNWECGVVVPVTAALSQPGTAAHGDDSRQSGLAGATRTTATPTTAGVSDLEAVFASTVPVPMVVPGRPYGPNEEPWFFAGSR